MTTLETDGYDCYFGVAPRRRGTTDGDKSALACAVTCHIDLDHFGDLDVAALVDRWHPSAIVNSGRGYHMYWRLWKANTRFPAVQAANRGLAEAFSADSCHDVTRVLRIPTTLNQRCRLRASKVVLPPGNHSQAGFALCDFPAIEDTLDTLCGKGCEDAGPLTEEQAQALCPVFVKYDHKDRSLCDWRVAYHLAWRGVEQDLIVAALWNNPYGKARIRGAKYVAGTVKRAIERVRDAEVLLQSA